MYASCKCQSSSWQLSYNREFLTWEVDLPPKPKSKSFAWILLLLAEFWCSLVQFSYQRTKKEKCQAVQVRHSLPELHWQTERGRLHMKQAVRRSVGRVSQSGGHFQSNLCHQTKPNPSTGWPTKKEFDRGRIRKSEIRKIIVINFCFPITQPTHE